MINNNENNKDKASLLGIGLDNKDGHKRITKGENFAILGGSEETHDKLVETSIKFNEKLTSKGKRIENLSKSEFIDMINESKPN